MVLISLADDQSIELNPMDTHGLVAFTVKQWGNGSTTVYLTREEVVYVAEFLLNYIDTES